MPSPSTSPVSLPSIHEMFPDHLMNKDNGRRASFPQPLGVHRHRAPYQHGSAQPECHRLDEIPSTSYPSPSPTSSSFSVAQSSRRRSSTSISTAATSSSSSTTVSLAQQNIYAFNVLRSSPNASSLQHITTSSNFPCNNNNTINVNSTGTRPPHGHWADSHQYREIQHSRSAYPSPSDAYQSQQQRDPSRKIISNSGHLVPAPVKPQYRSVSGIPGPAGVDRASFSSGYLSHGQADDDDGDANAGAGSGQEEADPSIGKKHVCPTCFKRFNRPSSLRIHVNTHTGATPFRCPWPNCGREFNVNSNMRRHYRNHTSPGFSRQQQSSSSTSPLTSGSTPGSGVHANVAAPDHINIHPEGRRKRRRVSIPLPPPPASTHRVTDTFQTSQPLHSHINTASKRTPDGYIPYPHGYPDPRSGSASGRSAYTYTPYKHEREDEHEHEQSGYEYSYDHESIHRHREQPGTRAYPREQDAHYYNAAESAIPSPPISNISMSEEDDELDGSSGDEAGEERCHTSYPYSAYTYSPRSHSRPHPYHSTRSYMAPCSHARSERGSHHNNNAHLLTPQSTSSASLRGSSASLPSCSPASSPAGSVSPLPDPQDIEDSIIKPKSTGGKTFKASMPYIRSTLDDKKNSISTVLRPAFVQ